MKKEIITDQHKFKRTILRDVSFKYLRGKLHLLSKTDPSKHVLSIIFIKLLHFTSSLHLKQAIFHWL